MRRTLTRRQAIAAAGVAGGAYLIGSRRLPGSTLVAPEDALGASTAPACTLAPSLTEGPYWVDELLKRSDVRVDPTDGSVQAGVPVQLEITIVRSNTSCGPEPDAAVDIWQASATGLYSDEAALGTTGKKYLRGYQVTDAQGKVTFTTIFPGWYRGRTVHIHVRVRTSNGATTTYNFTTQLFFDDTLTNQILATSPYNSRGTRDTTNATDMIYAQSGGKTLLALTPTSSGYKTAITLGLSGLPAPSTTAIRASVSSRHFTNSASAGRELHLKLDSEQKVSVGARLVRGSNVIAHARLAALAAGMRTLELRVGKTIRAGKATLEVMFTDASGNKKVIKSSVNVPAAKH
jgi:protocatechuate 3,4-dioxygenase beta subunit